MAVTERRATDTEGQALAAWADMLSQIRLNELAETLKQQDVNFDRAMELLDECRRRVREEVVENGAGRGGPHGMKGFIAERMDVFIGNARDAVHGAAESFELLDDNGPVDIMRDGIGIQQKFYYQYSSIDAMTKHLDTYPDFLEKGQVYRIAKDVYEELMRIDSVSEGDLAKLPLVEQGVWHRLRAAETKGIVLGKTVEPANINYGDSFKENYAGAIKREEDSLRTEDARARTEARDAAKPTIGEAAKMIGAGAALEGGTALASSLYNKIHEGKKIGELKSEDWKDIGFSTAQGTAKGGVRGAVVYAVVNYTPMPGAAATAMVTATYGMIGQARQLRNGKISDIEFIENSEALCYEVAISAISAAVGQTLIPVPVLGSLVGSIVGGFMLDIARTVLSDNEIKLIGEFQKEIDSARRSLDVGLRNKLEKYEAEIVQYDSLIDRLFDVDIQVAHAASIEFAERAGVEEELMLRSLDDGFEFFDS